ncbi:MAG TPA: hypothetical protein VNJ53_02790 [Gaiellaceae bacterium]|nr:hypothetical protein [Gaiellaceae bacterium]
MLRIVVIAAFLAVGLAVAKQQHLFERAGVVGSCQRVAAPIGDRAQWRACKQGFLTGYPNLLGESCTYELTAAGYEYWRCPS